MAQQNLYGQVGPNLSRFQVAGDNRRMYPISAMAGLFGAEVSYLSQFEGGVEQKNLVPLNGSLAQFPADQAQGAVISAARMGVTGASGGNIFLNNTTANVTPVFMRMIDTNPTIFAGGEIVMRDTNPSATPTNNPNPAANSYGGIYELFTVGAVTLAAFASGASSLVSSAALSTLALTTGYGAYTNGPVAPLPAAGDIVRITNTTSTLFSYHRITSIAGTTINIAPNTVFANTGASAFSLLRVGNVNAATYSRIIPITDTSTGSRYLYYATLCGLTSGTPTGTPANAGHLQAVKYDGTTSQTSHFMAPRQGAGADWYVTDIALYKGFLLYGNSTSIGWSVAGFPTSFTTAFGNTDLPATNVSVVSLKDKFVSFEYLGEQLIAIFSNSIWQVQATGTVPEFAFYQLAEPISVGGTSAATAARPSVSARGAVYYFGPSGLMELTGGIAVPVSGGQNSLLVATPTGGSTQVLPDITWEPFTDSIILTLDTANSNLTQFTSSMAYHRPSKTWWQPDLAFVSASLHGITGGAGTAPQSGLGASIGSLFAVDLAFYDAVSEKMVNTDPLLGGPANVTTNLNHNANWSWKSMVVSMGDDYGQVSGFQVEGNLATGLATWQMFGGPSPYALVQRATGTISQLGNRVLLGKKIDDPFIQIRISASAVNAPIKQFTGVNLYTEGRGR